MGKQIAKAGQWLYRNIWLYYFLTWTWGLLFTVIGLLWSIVMLVTFHRPRRFHQAWYFISWFKGGWGCNLGPCFIISKDSMWKGRDGSIHIYDDICEHELGHSYQNAIFGPFFIFIAILSVVRFWWRALYTKVTKKDPKTEYDDVWWEGSATAIGMYINMPF